MHLDTNNDKSSIVDQDQYESVAKFPRLEVEGVTKLFPGVRALDHVDMVAMPNEILSIVGENGAGKSTLFDVIMGIQRPNEGEIRLDGRKISPHGTYDSMHLGIFRVFQEQGLIGEFAVYENLCLGMEEKFVEYGVLQKARMIQHAKEALHELGLELDVRQLTRRLSFGIRQLIEVCRVAAMSKLLRIENPIVLMDEPTAALSGSELELFFELIQRLKNIYHASVVFVSHRLEEILSLSDRIYVMKDGQIVSEVKPTIDEGELHNLMVGRVKSSDFYAESLQRINLGVTLLEVENLSSDAFQNISLTVKSGEILGIGGLIASGKSRLGKAIYGAFPCQGAVRMEGKRMDMSMAERIQHGIGYIPIDRHREGILLGRSIVENISLIALPKLSPAGVLRPGREKVIANRVLNDLRIKAIDIYQRCRTLSGGNQQKVVLGKWLAAGLKMLIADNPTRGVDAGAKEEMYRLLRELASKGVCIVLISDDLLELIGLSNRIIIMRDGIITGELSAHAGEKPHEHEVVRLMV